MSAEIVLFTLLHLLVFAYWLGGDIGVFYSSFLLADGTRAPAGRLAAGKVLNDVDLVPRFALLLTLPTGLALARAKGWLAIDTVGLGAAFAGALVWALLVFHLHHAPATSALRAVDFGLRLALLSGLALVGAAGLLGVIALPTFLSIKCLLLAFCVAMGVCVRLVLKPFGPALLKLANGAGDAESDHIVSTSLNRTRPLVVMIWIALIAAAALGVAAPA
jgi:hypothetical protein